MNFIFFALALIGFITVGWRQLVWVPTGDAVAPMEKLSRAIVESAGSSVELALSLIGMMALFLGLMKVAEEGGLLVMIARLIRPFMKWLFPEVPPNHPATGAMVLNFSANLMGLGNAATPFGIRAMQELEKLNPCPGTATNAMVLFVAINTAGITLVPTGVIALRAAAGSANPAGILPTTLFASFCATFFTILATRAYQRFFSFPGATGRQVESANDISSGREDSELTLQSESSEAYPLWVSCLALGLLITAIPLTVVFGRLVSPWFVPGITIGFLAFGMARKVHIHEVFVEGAKEGFQVAVKIIPYLVAIFVAMGMLRASGAIDAASNMLGAWTAAAGLPPEGLLMAMIRPLSGSGAYGVVASVIKNPAVGPDSYTGYLVSTLQGSSETTFYVLAVYFGAIQVRRIRQALIAGLTAEFIAVIAAVAVCRYLYG
ncbi:MAG: nucleoside recognition domain-containing protein [Syntrophobacteraceae bacterium]|jgi:spore maturation protein SpmA